MNDDDVFKICHPHRLVLNTPFDTKSIISYGLIVYAKSTQNWIIIQRKHSVEFMIYMKGLYRETFLPFLLSAITLEESYIIKKCIELEFDFFSKVYIEDLGCSIEELSYAFLRFSETKHIVSKILDNIDNSKNTLKWTWPKGRLNIGYIRESPYTCAIREFKEEVEIDLPPPLYISDNYITETCKTFMGRTIESKYWIYIIDKEIPIVPPKQHTEVSDRKWVNTETVCDLFRNELLLKKIINMVQKLE